MEKKVHSELQAIKQILSHLVGTANSPKGERFSTEALDQAARHFQKLSIDRGDWVEEWDIGKIIKDAPYNKVGAFIRTEFGFSNYFKRGKKFYYNKKDLITLSEELKTRNINLKRYCELREDELKFNKLIESASANSKGKDAKKFTLPYDVRDIITSSPKAPSEDVIRESLVTLKQEFFHYKLSDYVDIHNGNHAMMKYEYYFQKYIKADIKSRCRKWCDNFNYANHALKLVTNKTDKFVPVKDDDMIQL